jgi:orotate phosphoribosyltransferase
VQSGHFLLSSGRHSDTYVQCARVLEHPNLSVSLAETLSEILSEKISNLKQSIDYVVSPAIGGLLFGFCVAYVLHKPFVFTERVGGKMTFRRSFPMPKNALIVEDVITTGGSTAEVIDLIGENIVAVACIVNRNEPKKITQTPISLAEIDVKSWNPQNCYLCKKGIPMNSPGSRFNTN